VPGRRPQPLVLRAARGLLDRVSSMVGVLPKIDLSADAIRDLLRAS
jgi:hypothetical protein